jgi:hypothetical protein
LTGEELGFASLLLCLVTSVLWGVNVLRDGLKTINHSLAEIVEILKSRNQDREP